MCGKSFTLLNAFTNHSCTFPQSKKCLSDALHQAKQRWTIREHRCVAVDQLSSASELSPQSSCALGTVGLISDRELWSLRWIIKAIAWYAEHSNTCTPDYNPAKYYPRGGWLPSFTGAGHGLTKLIDNYLGGFMMYSPNLHLPFLPHWQYILRSQSWCL